MGRVPTAGAALSHMDPPLWPIRQASPMLADTTARHLVVDSRPTQPVDAIADHLAHSDPLVQLFDCWAREHLAGGFSLDAAAHATGASKGRSHGASTTRSARARCPTSRICASSAPCTCCVPPMTTW